MGTTLSQLSVPTTAEIWARFAAGDEARALVEQGRLDPRLAPGAFLDTLVEAGLLVDGLRFLAYALPRRHAVWWACRCVHVLDGSGTALSRAPLEAAETWVRDPSEENRRAAMSAAEVQEFRSPEAWAAVGAFWAEGSLSPPGAPVVPPGETLTGHAVAGAVLLAAVESEPEKAPEKQRRFVSLAVEIANHPEPWTPGGRA
jgi:hypothetical protein